MDPQGDVPKARVLVRQLAVTVARLQVVAKAVRGQRKAAGGGKGGKGGRGNKGGKKGW